MQRFLHQKSQSIIVQFSNKIGMKVYPKDAKRKIPNEGFCRRQRNPCTGYESEVNESINDIQSDFWQPAPRSMTRLMLIVVSN